MAFFKKKNKDVAAGGEGVDVVGTEDIVELSAAKLGAGVDMKTTLIMVLVGLIAVMCAFVLISKSPPPFKEGAGRNGTVGSDGKNSVAKSEADEMKEGIDLNADGENSEDIKESKADDKGDYKGLEDKEYVGQGTKESKTIVPLESIVANLGGIESRRYLRVQVNLELKDSGSKGIIDERMIEIRDNLLSYFSKKTAKEIESQGSLFKLRLEIRESLSKLLGIEDIITQIYFSDFIVQ